MSNATDWPGDVEALAKQYWQAWSEALRQAGATAQPAFAAPAGVAMPGFAANPFAPPPFAASPFAASPFAGFMPPAQGNPWQEMLAQWSRVAMGQPQPQPADFSATLNESLGRLQAQAGQWYGKMQQLAAQFAGQGASAADIAAGWKALLTEGGEGVWLELVKGMQPAQPNGFDAWYAQAQPLLNQWLAEARRWLALPAVGVAREHQERLQKLMQAQLDYQEKLAAHNAALGQTLQQAVENFEAKLSEHEAPGQEITSGRALFDVWIDAAEDAFAQMALSDDYREVYGQLVNAQMRLKQDVQKEVENASGALGMPTRTEVEAAHRKIAELERAIRRLQRQGEGRVPQTAPADGKAATRPVAVRRAAKVAPAAAKKKAAAGTRSQAASVAGKKAAEKAAKKAAEKAAKKPAAKPSARLSVSAPKASKAVNKAGKRQPAAPLKRSR